MSVLLLGANGQLGRHLRRAMPDAVTCARRAADHVCDLGDADAVAGLLDAVGPRVVINAVAWTAVDAAEDHADEAFALNRDLPAGLADWCRRHQALLVHYSTDYVFSGDPGRGWREDDAVAPESVYGRTKLAGEQAVAASGCRALVLRTAWVYSALPGNFLSAILARAGRGEDLRVVADQTGSPTWAGTLARVTGELIESADEVDRPVLLHVAGRGAMSWHDFAVAAVQRAAGRGIIERAVAVASITSDQWPQRATRPAWSVLDCSRCERITGRRLPDIEQALDDCLNQWSEFSC